MRKHLPGISKIGKLIAVMITVISATLFTHCELGRELLNNDNQNPTGTNVIIISVTSPTNGESIGTNYTVIGSAYGSAGLISGSVYFCPTNNGTVTNRTDFSLNGEKMEVFRPLITIPAEGIYWVWTKVVDVTGQSLYSPPILALADGSVNFTNQLSLAFTQPTDGYQVTPAFTYKVTVSSSVGLDVLNMYYTLSNGTGTTNIITQEYNGETAILFSTNLTISPDGNYALWLRGVDIFGQPKITDPIYILVTNTYVEDTTPPTLTISTPTNGSTVGLTSQVSGTVFDSSGVKNVMLRINGGDFSPVSINLQNWSTNVTFPSAGNYTLDVYAVDNASNYTTTNSVTVTSDPGMVSIAFTTPASGKMTNTTSLYVAGTASVEVASLLKIELSVNGGGFSSGGITGLEMWSGSVTLSEGSNTIVARGIADNGKTNSTSPVVVIVDTTAPTVIITDPTNGQVIQNMVSYITRGTANDNISGISQVYIAVDSQTYQPANGTTNWNLGFTFSIATHDIHVYAVDAMGNVSTTNTISVEFTSSDSVRPTISITSPSGGSTANSALTVTGTAEDNNSVIGVYVKLNSGAFQQATGTNSWFKNVTLAEGANTVYAYAKDVAGNFSDTNSATVTYNPPSGMTVYFKKPSDWTTGGVYIHYWDGPAGTTNTTWASCPACVNEGDGWYSFTFGDRTNSSLLFKNQSGTNNNKQSADLSRAGTGWYYTDNKWYDSNPDGDTPVLNITSPNDGRQVTSSSIFVTGTAVGGTTAVKVSVNGGAFATATGTGTWTYQAPLIMGTNAIAVYATNTTSGTGSDIQYRMVIRKEASGDVYPGSYSGNLGSTLYADGVEFAIHWRYSIVSAVAVTGDFNGWTETAMAQAGSDVWHVFIPGAGVGDEYKFVGAKTGGDVTIADPYSKFNRYSGGNSVVVDQDAYTWNDSSWNRPGWDYYSIYELHVKDFTKNDPSVSAANRGKYLGIIEKLDYLTNLGITAIELMPISEFGDGGYSWGYETCLFMAVESGYAVNPLEGQGGVDEFKAMVDACHQYGVAVIVDMVFNHTDNDDNWLWMMDTELYFYWGGVPGSTPWGNKLATWNDDVKRLGKDTLEYFMNDLHVDGFRFDATHTDFMDHSFIQAIKTHCNDIDSAVFFTYENLPNQSDLKYWGSQWSDPYHDDGVNLFRDGGADLTWMANKIKGEESWASSPYEIVNYVESHDEDSLGYHAFDGTYGAGYDSGTAKARSRAMIVMLATSMGHPMIQMGQEFLRDKEGQNTDEAFNTIDWSLATTYSDLVTYYGGVLRLRKDYPVFRLYDSSKHNWETGHSPWDGNTKQCTYYLNSDTGKDAVVMLNLDRWNSYSGWLPAGNWIKIVNESEAYTSNTMDDYVTGGVNISVGANSGVIFVQQ